MERNDKILKPIGRTGSNISTNVAYEQRVALADYLMSKDGSVPWQNDYVNKTT